MSKFSLFFKNLFFSTKKEEVLVIEMDVKPAPRTRVRKRKENTKHEQVKRHLFEKGSIDSWTAIQLYGATRLAHIIYILRKEGYQIDSVPQSSYDRNKQICNFTTYKINQ